MVSKEEIIEILKTIKDPEIDLDVWTLGLVYNIDIDGNSVKIKMTLTSPMCPFGPQIIEEAKEKIAAMNGVDNIQLDVVFEPPWQPSEELRAMFGV